MPARRVVAVGLATVAALALSGCDRSGPLGEDEPDTHVVEVRGARTGFTVDMPVDWGITHVRDEDTCGSVSYRVREEGSLRLVISAVPTTCPEAADNTQIGNGFHGIYRTVDDVPDPQDVATVGTGLGEATVFAQEYFECTNSCERWDEQIAIVTLDQPVDPGYPTLVLRGERDTVSREELEEILGTLEAPYVPTG